MQLQSKFHKGFVKKTDKHYNIYIEMQMTKNSESQVKKKSWRKYPTFNVKKTRQCDKVQRTEI